MNTLDNLFVLRKKQKDGTYWYNIGAGSHVTPKLYTLKGAKAAATNI